MKRSSKFIALALVLVMVFSMIPFTAVSAADAGTITVYFQNNWLWTDVKCHYWGGSSSTGWPGAAMEKVATWEGNDVYAITIPANSTGIIFNGKKNDGSGNLDQTPDIKTGIVDGAAWKMDWNNGNKAIASTYAPEAHSHSYDSTGLCECNERAHLTVAGNNATLFGTEWDTTNTANDLTLEAETGLWSITYTNATEAAMALEFKVVQDYSWGKEWGAAAAGLEGNNVAISLPAAHTLTITVNYSTDKMSLVIGGHTFADADCDSPKTCACGETQGEANGHNYVAGQVVAPTVDSEGYTVYTCTACGATEKCDTVPALVAVAKIGENGYATLADALAVGGEIVLLDNIKIDAPVVVTGTVVLDLNGFELSYTSTTMGEAMITNKGNLTINDSVGTGVINYNYVGANDASYGKGNYTISNGGTLTVNGGEITIANLRSHAKYPIDNNSTTGDAILVINGGHLYNYNTSAIRMFCNSTTYKNSVTINGGLVEGYCAIWMQNPGKNTVHGALTITGGEIRTTAAAYVNGTAALKDVSSNLYTTIDGEGGAWSDDSLVAITGGTLNENVNVYYEAPANVTIGEATFNGNCYYVLPHEHNFVEGKCECGEEDPNYVPPHVNTLVVGETNKIVVTGETLNAYNLPIEWVYFVATEAGYFTFTGDNGAIAWIYDLEDNLLCGMTGKATLEAGTYVVCVGNGFVGEFNVVVTRSDEAPHTHNFVEGKCECGETDPDYVAPVANPYLINFSEWEEFAKGTYADGDVVKHNDVFTFIMGKNSRVDASSKTWDDFSGTLRFSLGGKTNSGVPTKNAIQITADGAYTLKVWYVAGGDGRYFALVDANGEVLSETTKETAQNGLYYAEIAIPAAGTYYLTIPADNNYIFQLEMVKMAAPETPHVNTLVVGETNKIVVDDSRLNALGYYVAVVPFEVTEKAVYSFVNAAGFALIYDGNEDTSTNLCGFLGTATLDVGTYYIWVSAATPATTGEYNVSVTKTELPPHVNTLVVGETNKIVVDDSRLNGLGYYVAVVPFEVTEKAVYSFVNAAGFALIYDGNEDTSTNLCGFLGTATLDVGTYYIWVSAATPATTGEYNVSVTKTAIGGGEDPVDPPVENPTHDGEQKLVLGDNTIVIDGCTVNIGNPPTAIEWAEFIVTDKDVYTITSDTLNCYIYATKDLYTMPLCSFSGVAELEPGTYYVCLGKQDVRGEHTVSVAKATGDVELPHKNTMVVGDNHYLITDLLATTGFELFVPIEITEPGVYTITGGAPMKVYFWYILGESSGNNFASNMDGFSDTGFADSFEVTLTEAGTYYMGFNYDLVTEEREFDINVSFKEELPAPEHTCEHVCEECGKCTDAECSEAACADKCEGHTDEPVVDPQPEMNFFQKIIAWFMELIQKILGLFKRN